MVEILGDDRFKFRNNLPIKLARIIKRAAEHCDLKKQLERHERERKIDDLWPAVSEVLAYQIQIARQPAICIAQASINAAIFQRAEDSASKGRNREQVKDSTVIKERRHPCLRFTGILAGL